MLYQPTTRVANPYLRDPQSTWILIAFCAAGVQGEYDVQVVARDTQNVELMCVVVHFEMVPPSIPSWPGNNEAVATSRKMLKDNSKQAVV